MRDRFRKTLETYGDIIKAEPKKKYKMKGLESSVKKTGGDDIEKVLNWHVTQEAEKQSTDKEAQQRIVDIQKKKQEIMRWLKAEFKNMEDPEYVPEKEEDAVEVKVEKGSLVRDGEERISIGELYTDGDWDVSYYCDPKSVPITLRKRFLLEEAKRKLQEYLDEQIITAETHSRIAHPKRKDIYTKMKEERASGEERPGHLFERMVRNFFKKLSIDHDLPFSIEQADIQQDVEDKIDFIMRRSDRYRGVGVEASEKVEKFGVQITTDTREKTRTLKEKMLARVRSRLEGDTFEDIVLVVIPTKHVGIFMKQWQDKGKRAGGPEKEWDKDFKKKVFYSVLDKFAKKEDLDAWWKKIEKQS